MGICGKLSTGIAGQAPQARMLTSRHGTGAAGVPALPLLAACGPEPAVLRLERLQAAPPVAVQAPEQIHQHPPAAPHPAEFDLEMPDARPRLLARRDHLVA